MAKRKHSKQADKAERLEADEARQQAERRQRRKSMLIGLTIFVLAAGGSAVAVRLVGHDGDNSSAQAPAGVKVEKGFIVSKPPWPPEYSSLKERLASLNLPGGEGEGYHIHPLLTVFANGKQIAVPPNIGLTSDTESPLHTHTPDGVVHVEAPVKYPYEIADIFTIWGVKLSDTQLGPFRNKGDETVQIYVNGKLLTDDPASYVFKDQDNIVVGYGRPDSFETEPDASALGSF